MKSFALAAAALAAVPFTMGQMQVNSLNGVVECEPILISWTGGSPPYYVSLIPAGQPAAPPIKQFPVVQSGNSFTWIVDLPAGTAFTTELKDASGQPVYSGNQNVESGSSSNCANTSGSAAASATSPGAAAADPTNSSSSMSTTAAAASGTTSHAASPASASGASGSHSTTGSAATLAASGSSATPSATQNAAVRGSSVGVYGLTGILGLIGAAIF